METKSKNNAEVAITEQEFKTIKAVMERVGASEIFYYFDVLELLYSTSFRDFFKTQPVALSIITMERENDEDVETFVKQLGRINAFISEIAEESQLYRDISRFLHCVHEASKKYGKPN